MSRHYMSVEQVERKLLDLVLRCRYEGRETLPSERAILSEILCCTMTLRRALDTVEQRGVIRRENGVKYICDTARNLSVLSAISVAFFACGDNAVPFNRHYLRIALALERRFRGTPVNFQTFCLSAQDEEKFKRGPAAKDNAVGLFGLHVRIPDVVIYADAATELEARILSLRGRTLLVGVNENYVGRCDCIVALNNFEAGRIAANLLIQSGCKHPAIIFDDRGHAPFDHRRDGFVTALREAGISLENAVWPITRNNGLVVSSGILTPDLLNSILDTGCDGLFLFTDQGSETLRGWISQRLRIPEEFKLVTLDAAGVCRQANPPITAISHASDEIAEALEELIVARAQKRPYQQITLVTPNIFPGSTL